LEERIAELVERDKNKEVEISELVERDKKKEMEISDLKKRIERQEKGILQISIDLTESCNHWNQKLGTHELKVIQTLAEVNQLYRRLQNLETQNSALEFQPPQAQSGVIMREYQSAQDELEISLIEQYITLDSP
jgi:hypothetical protein